MCTGIILGQLSNLLRKYHYLSPTSFLPIICSYQEVNFVRFVVLAVGWLRKKLRGGGAE